MSNVKTRNYIINRIYAKLEVWNKALGQKIKILDQKLDIKAS